MTTAAALQSEAQQLPSDTSEPGDQPPVLGQADLPASLGLFPRAAVSRGLGEPVLKVAVACAGLPEGRVSSLFLCQGSCRGTHSASGKMRCVREGE